MKAKRRSLARDAIAWRWHPKRRWWVSPASRRGRGCVARGRRGVLALRPTLTTEAHRIVEAGDIALYCVRWRLSGRDPAGQAVETRGCSADVLLRQPDERWLIALDSPWGTAIPTTDLVAGGPIDLY